MNAKYQCFVDGVKRDFISVTFQHEPRDVTSKPTFTMSFPNPFGSESGNTIFSVGKEVRIHRIGGTNEQVFTGTIEPKTLRVDPNNSTINISGINTWYKLLDNLPCDSYDFVENSTDYGVTINPWEFRLLRFTHPESTLSDVSVGERMVLDGFRIDDVIRHVIGTKFCYSHDYQDLSHLLPSTTSGPEDYLQVYRDNRIDDSYYQTTSRLQLTPSGMADNPANTNTGGATSTNDPIHECFVNTYGGSTSGGGAQAYKPFNAGESSPYYVELKRNSTSGPSFIHLDNLGFVTNPQAPGGYAAAGVFAGGGFIAHPFTVNRNFRVRKIMGILSRQTSSAANDIVVQISDTPTSGNHLSKTSSYNTLQLHTSSNNFNIATDTYILYDSGRSGDPVSPTLNANQEYHVRLSLTGPTTGTPTINVAVSSQVNSGGIDTLPGTTYVDVQNDGIQDTSATSSNGLADWMFQLELEEISSSSDVRVVAEKLTFPNTNTDITSITVAVAKDGPGNDGKLVIRLGDTLGETPAAGDVTSTIDFAVTPAYVPFPSFTRTTYTFNASVPAGAVKYLNFYLDSAAPTSSRYYIGVTGNTIADGREEVVSLGGATSAFDNYDVNIAVNATRNGTGNLVRERLSASNETIYQSILPTKNYDITGDSFKVKLYASNSGASGTLTFKAGTSIGSLTSLGTFPASGVSVNGSDITFDGEGFDLTANTTHYFALSYTGYAGGEYIDVDTRNDNPYPDGKFYTNSTSPVAATDLVMVICGDTTTSNQFGSADNVIYGVGDVGTPLGYVDIKYSPGRLVAQTFTVAQRAKISGISAWLGKYNSASDSKIVQFRITSTLGSGGQTHAVFIQNVSANTYTEFELTGLYGYVLEPGTTYYLETDTDNTVSGNVTLAAKTDNPYADGSLEVYQNGSVTVVHPPGYDMYGTFTANYEGTVSCLIENMDSPSQRGHSLYGGKTDWQTFNIKTACTVDSAEILVSKSISNPVTGNVTFRLSTSPTSGGTTKVVPISSITTSDTIITLTEFVGVSLNANTTYYLSTSYDVGSSSDFLVYRYTASKTYFDGSLYFHGNSTASYDESIMSFCVTGTQGSNVLTTVDKVQVYNSFGEVESITLYNGDPNIEPMGLIKSVQVTAYGKLNGGVIRFKVCRNGGRSHDPVGGHTFNSGLREYVDVRMTTTEVTIPGTSDTITKFSGEVGEFYWYGAGTGNELAYLVYMSASENNLRTPELEYVMFNCVTESDTIVTESPGNMEEYFGDPTLDGSDFFEGNLESSYRLDALGDIRSQTIKLLDSSDPVFDDEFGTFWDIWMDSVGQLHFKKNRGSDINRTYSFDDYSMSGAEYELDGSDVWYAAIGLGAGSGAFRTRIVSREEFSLGGLRIDANRALYGSAAKVGTFENSSASPTQLLRGTRAALKLHSKPFESLSLPDGLIAEDNRYYDVGDILTFNIPDLNLLDKKLPIEELSRTVDKNGETINIVLGHPRATVERALSSLLQSTQNISIVPQPKRGQLATSASGTFFDNSTYGLYTFGISEPEKISKVALKFVTVPYTVKTYGESVGIFVFDGDDAGVPGGVPGKATAPIYATNVEVWLDTTEAPIIGLDDLKKLPLSFGKEDESVEVDEFDVTNRLARDANGLIKRGVHYLWVRSTTVTAPNVLGLGEIQVNPLIDYKN